ncbi:hypothetical protein B0H11DRAFT_1991637 [Mycena galericulata]|nr:hypothetical protein B0H11DRAFT_1991637 [Mycena galericulata]
MDERAFPVEIEREIFETAAIRHPTLTHSLLRVSHRVHAWIERYLYRILIIRNSNPTASAFQAKPASFLAMAVRHASVSSEPNLESGIINLNLDGDVLSMCEALGEMNVQKLALTPSGGTTFPPLNHPVFLSVTHLDVYKESRDVGSWQTWSHLAALPALTHLCLSESISRAILPQVVEKCPQLHLIVTAYWGLGCRIDALEFAETLTFNDHRVVVMAVATDHETDWGKGATQDNDFWVRAEIFLTRKRNGEIDANVRCFFDD